MADAISDRIWSILTCSFCGSPLARGIDGAKCTGCGLEYPNDSSGAMDLRLKKPRQYDVKFELGVPLLPEGGFVFGPLAANPAAEVDFSNVELPHHLNPELLSYFPKAKAPGSLMLDLGCGNGMYKGICEMTGHEWVGLDYDELGAPILGDGHALPFKSVSFDCIVSLAVLEHIQFPFVMMHEAYRVLKPGGRFLGVVAFLEPFHGNSFYNHSHLGAYNSLKNAGFKVEKIAPYANWSSLDAQAVMGLFPRMPGFLSNALIAPTKFLHKIWWQLGRMRGRNADEVQRLMTNAASFVYIASK